MSNYQNKYQQDVTAIASSIMTQILAQEKGIDMNVLMEQAQQMHLEQIMQQEQQFQMKQMLRNHYQGRDTSFFGKLRTAFAGDVNGSMGAPMPMMQQPQQGASVDSIASFLSGQAQPSSPVVGQPVAPPVGSVPNMPDDINF